MIAGLLPGALLLLVAVVGQGGASAAEPAVERAEDTETRGLARVPAAARGIGDPARGDPAAVVTHDWLDAQARTLQLLKGGAQPAGGFRTLALADLQAGPASGPGPEQPRGDTAPKLWQARRQQFALEDPAAADLAAGGPVRLRSGTRVYDTGRWERADGAGGLGAFRLHDDTWMFPDAASDRIVGHIQELGRNERSWPVVWRGLHWERPDGTTGRADLLPDETVLFPDGRWERADGGAGEGATVLEDKTVVFPDGTWLDPVGNPWGTERALWLPASGTWVLPMGYWARVAGGSGFGALRLPGDTVAFRSGDAWWWERADGSRGDGLPPGSVTLPSGTLVLPGGLWREPGGKLGQGATILASGTVVFDRSGRWERLDGSAGPRAVRLHDTTWVFSDGRWEGPQGSGAGATVSDDGTVVIPNNRIEYPDKTVAWADGRVDFGVVHVSEDGSEWLADGSRRFRDDRVRLLSGDEIDRHGTWTFPNGDKYYATGVYWHARTDVYEYRPDPVEASTDEPAASWTRRPAVRAAAASEGEVDRVPPEWHVLWDGRRVEADGTVEQWPPGSVQLRGGTSRIPMDDGTVGRRYPGGATLRANGTWELPPGGSVDGYYQHADGTWVPVVRFEDGVRVYGPVRAYPDGAVQHTFDAAFVDPSVSLLIRVVPAAPAADDATPPDPAAPKGADAGTRESSEPPVTQGQVPLAVRPPEQSDEQHAPIAGGIPVTPPAPVGGGLTPVAGPAAQEGGTRAEPGLVPDPAPAAQWPSPQEREPAAPDRGVGAAAGSRESARGADEVAGSEVAGEDGEVSVAGGAGGVAGTSAERGSGGGEGTDPAPSDLDLDGALVVGSGADVAGFGAG